MEINKNTLELYETALNESTKLLENYMEILSCDIVVCEIDSTFNEYIETKDKYLKRKNKVNNN